MRKARVAALPSDVRKRYALPACTLDSVRAAPGNWAEPNVPRFMSEGRRPSAHRAA